MGLFDNIKKAVQNAASDLQAAQAQADALDLYTLCDMLKDLKKLDPRNLVYRQAIKDKCSVLPDDDLEAFYARIKKAGTIFKQHPAQSAVEDVLVEKNMYVRHEDGTISKNSACKWFK